MVKPRLLFVSLGGTITMTPSAGGGIAPALDAEQLVASVPGLADVARIEVRSPRCVPSPALAPADLIELARTLDDALASEFDGAVIVQGTDTLEEAAFLLDLLVDSAKPVVVTGAMRGPGAPGADGPANLFAAAIVAGSRDAHDLGTLVVLNYDIHAARFVQKSHTALPSAFLSPLVGELGVVAERRTRLYVRVPRMPRLPVSKGPPAPVALVKMAMGDDGRLLRAVPDLGFSGCVIEGMGAGHVPPEVAPIVSEVAQRIPVVLASRVMTGPVFTRTYGYDGGEMDLIRRGVQPAGFLSGLKARLLLGLALRAPSSRDEIAKAFAPYQ